jgi:cytochrome P450 family 26 subfamily A
LDVIFFLEESYSGIWLLLLLMQIFKTHLLFCLTIYLGAPEGNKFLFANENKLVQNSWPPSVAKLLGRHAISIKTGEEHK